MPYTDEFEREWRNTRARAQYAMKKRNAEKAKQPYTPKMLPAPGSLHDKLLQLLKPVDFGEECMVQEIAHSAARLDFFVRLGNQTFASPAPGKREIEFATKGYEIARKTLRTQVKRFRSRRPSPRKKTITKQSQFEGNHNEINNLQNDNFLLLFAPENPIQSASESEPRAAAEPRSQRPETCNPDGFCAPAPPRENLKHR